MTQFKYLKEVIVIFEKFVDEFGGEVIGCTHEEVDLLESMFSPFYHLPNAYKEFLIYGGKRMGKLYGQIFDFTYGRATSLTESDYKDIITILRTFDANARIPSDLFVLSYHLTSYFDYFLLTEGDNPPVYDWSEEDDRGLEVSQKYCDSFTDYLIEEMRKKARLIMGTLTREKLKAKTPPRGEQFWLPTQTERIEGITRELLRSYFGVSVQDFQNITAFTGLDIDSYLEELSGWKCRKITEDDTEIRFFPDKIWQNN